MARPSNIQNPVRELRELLGEKQDCFAFDQGFSPSLWQKIETGKRNLSPKLANQLCAKYGVNSQTIKNTTGKAYYFDGRILTKELLDEWNKEQHRKDQDDFLCDELVFQLRTVLECAKKRSHGTELAFGNKLSTAFWEFINENKLKDEIDEYLKGMAEPIQEEEITVEELNHRFSSCPEWMQISPRYPLMERARLTGKRIPLLVNQCSTVPVNSQIKSINGIGFLVGAKAWREEYKVEIGKRVYCLTVCTVHGIFRLPQTAPGSSPASAQSQSTPPLAGE